MARRNNLANVHMNCFDDDAALGLYREALEGQRRVLGDSHPSTLLSAGNLGSLLLQVRDTQPRIPNAKAHVSCIDTLCL